ncbi:hypothetical protein [Afipia carboxidovorans]|uniref:hypothetical protein n=1 Tax=Afipia carboxidovorans TaxID=40137 RepID=UPI003085EA74|nr:hypothetical protein CRBSH125_09490 [Afipia carboxidovorans]
MIRSGRVAVRQTAKVPVSYKPHTIPAPTLGIIANSNPALPPEGGALILENFIPRATDALLRRGSQLYQILSDAEAVVTSLFTYKNGNNEKFFAATGTNIYDISTATTQAYFTDGLGNRFVASGSGENAVAFIPSITRASSVVDDLTGGDWSVVQFATPGGVFLRAVNGADTPLVFDGTDWDTTPAITSPVEDEDPVDPTKLSYTWVHQQRNFFIEKDSLNAWYLPAASIGGDAVKLPLGGVFNLGGSLLFGSTWSLETGAGGLQENCIFVTTEGEVAVYQGTDPGTAATWSKVGIYRVGKPLGPNAHFRAGGDIVIATDIGLVPLSAALQKDFSILSPSAVSAQIETIWNDEVMARSGGVWRCQIWSANQIAIVNPPTVNNLPPVLYVVNLRTGAWGKFTGWDCRCMAVFKNRMFFGSTGSQVIEGNVTGYDMGRPYTGTYVPLFSDFGAPTTKTAGMTRAVLKSFVELNEQLSMHADFDVSMPAVPPGSIAPISNVWGGGIWGAAVWGHGLSKMVSGEWHSTPNTGNSLAPALQVTSASIVPIDAEILRMDVTYTGGDLVT